MVFHTNQLDSLSRDLTRLSKGGLSHKPGSNALAGGIITIRLSTDDPRVTAVSVLEEGPGKPPKTMEITAEMKHQLKKEIQRFGQRK